MVRSRISSTDWYSGVTSTITRITGGYESAGANVPENRNSPNWTTTR